MVTLLTSLIAVGCVGGVGDMLWRAMVVLLLVCLLCFATMPVQAIVSYTYKSMIDHRLPTYYYKIEDVVVVVGRRVSSFFVWIGS